MNSLNQPATRLVIIRHGKVDFPEGRIYSDMSFDPVLSIEGVEQMDNLGRELREQDYFPTVIYTSPLQRAQQSANAIAQYFPGVEILGEPDLRDSEVRGASKITVEQVHQHGDLFSAAGALGFEIELQEAVAERARQAIQEILEGHQGETVFVVSHGDPIAFGIWDLENPRVRLPAAQEIYCTPDYLEVGECCVLRIGGGGEIEREFEISLETRERPNSLPGNERVWKKSS